MCSHSERKFVGVKMPPEKNIITKTWERLDDDVIIKEVATMGKHVNLCIAFLAQRNELSHSEATNYFLQKVRIKVISRDDYGIDCTYVTYLHLKYGIGFHYGNKLQ